MCFDTNLVWSIAGEEHNCEPHFQDWQSPSGAGLLSQVLQPGGLRGAVPQDQTASLQLAFHQLAASTACPTADDGSQHPDADASLSELSYFVWIFCKDCCYFFFFFWCRYVCDSRLLQSSKSENWWRFLCKLNEIWLSFRICSYFFDKDLLWVLCCVSL